MSAPFAVIPAVDIKGGRCVRLYQGRPDEETVFADDPVECALRWESGGASMLHVVDLDGAFKGAPANRDKVVRVLEALTIPVEVGGGIRELAAARGYIEAGAARVVVGTRALTDAGWLAEMAENLGDRLAVGLDTRDGIVMVRGWTGGTGVEMEDAVAVLEDAGVRRLIHTSVGRDGTLDGPDVSGLLELARMTDLPIVASGGVGSIEDLVEVASLRSRGIEGVIVGMALYRGRFTLEEAIDAVEERQ